MILKRSAAVCVVLCLLGLAQPAWGFCGFYVAGAGAELYNNRSEIIIVRDGTRSIFNLAFDYRGEPDQFALVMPVPEVLSAEDVKVVKRELFGKLDRYTAPRLVQYHADDPCPEGGYGLGAMGYGAGGGSFRGNVQVLSAFSVEEYDVVVLGAEASNGLEDWLVDNGYHIPSGAAPYFTPYIEKGMYFFVVKVDLSRLSEEDRDVDDDGNTLLRPLQIGMDSEQLMLPIQLGKINALKEQHLIAYILSPEGRFRVANYANIQVPTDLYVPASFLKGDTLAHFYRDVVDVRFDAHPESVLTEYAWDIAKCDPCPSPPPTSQDLQELGAPLDRSLTITRLHARYTRDTMTEDLVFERDPLAGNTTFQARYIVQHPWEGEAACLETEDRRAWVEAFKLEPETRQDKKWLRKARKDPAVWGPTWLRYEREKLERASEEADVESSQGQLPSGVPLGLGLIVVLAVGWRVRRMEG